VGVWAPPCAVKSKTENNAAQTVHNLACHSALCITTSCLLSSAVYYIQR